MGRSSRLPINVIIINIKFPIVSISDSAVKEEMLLLQGRRLQFITFEVHSYEFFGKNLELIFLKCDFGDYIMSQENQLNIVLIQLIHVSAHICNFFVKIACIQYALSAKKSSFLFFWN